jgi:hypothetical protein
MNLITRKEYAVADKVIPTWKILGTVLYCFLFRKYLRIYIINPKDK